MASADHGDSQESPPQEQGQTPPQKISLRTIIPNLITLLALASGVSAIKFAFIGAIELSAYAILFSAILDGLDGQIARALRGTSLFGAELDSLADLVNFGVSPAIVLYIWCLHDLGNVGWGVCLAFIIAMALRLARFNVINHAGTSIPTPPKSYFLGVPAPAAALLLLFPIYLQLVGVITSPDAYVILIALFSVFVAVCAISRLKTFSPKNLKFPPYLAHIMILCLALFIICLMTFTWHTLLITSVVYIGHLIYRCFK